MRKSFVMLASLSKYIRAFKKLHVDRSHGIAPHKPILLLSVLQSYQDNSISENKVRITPELVALFKTNWNILVRTNHDCRITYPFYYLKSDRFWKLIPRNNYGNIEVLGSAVKSFNRLYEAIEYAFLAEDLFMLMLDSECNLVLQKFLLEEYFPDTKANMNETSQQYRLFEELSRKILNEKAVDYKSEIISLLEKEDEEEIYLRGNVFKREIPRIYNNTCCISGMRISSVSPISMIDACHIIPFSKSYNDTVSNGIALCPNLHRAFDRGLISLDENYRIIISKSFGESDSEYSICNFEGRKILLPENAKHFPLRSNLRWHRKNVFIEV